MTQKEGRTDGHGVTAIRSLHYVGGELKNTTESETDSVQEKEEEFSCVFYSSLWNLFVPTEKLCT